MSRHRLIAVLLAAAAFAPALADRLHLESGGVIETARWWVEGDTLMYESAAGVVGIPRSTVVRIEETGTPPPQKKATPPSRPEPAAAVSDRPDAEELAAIRGRFDKAVASLESRDFEMASSMFRELVRDYPELTAARVGYARSEMSLGSDVLALSTVQEGLARDPDYGQLHELLGDLRNREERVVDALYAWRRALELAPSERLEQKIAKAERELKAGRYYAFSTTPHFNVRYDADLDVELASAVTDFLEEQYWALADRFRHTPPQPITVLLYPTRDFREVTRAPEWVGGLYDGKIRVPLGGLSRVDPRAEAVLVHELAHAVVHSKTRGNCPRWLHEGLAQIAEERPAGPAERQEVADLLDGIAPEQWDKEDFSYPAALSLTRHLESLRGPYGVLDLLDALGEGRPIDDALARVFDVDYAALCRGWAERAIEETGR